MRHYERIPVIVVAETRGICRRVRKDDDAVRWKGSGVSVHVIDVVGYDEINGASRRHQLRRELRVSALGVDRRATRLLFARWSEVHPKMLRAHCAPVLIRRKLRTRGSSHAETQRGCERQRSHGFRASDAK